MDPLHTDLTDSILRCAIAVHREIGPGLPEHSYQTAVALEFDAAGIRYVSDRPITVRYRSVVVGWHKPDFIVDEKVIVELKTTANFDPAHSKQVLNYMKLTKLRVALLLNFGVASLGDSGIKRFQM
jgi:GxxExxY protein